MDTVNEIWENQRWYGIGWCAASALLLSQLAKIMHACCFKRVQFRSCGPPSPRPPPIPVPASKRMVAEQGPACPLPHGADRQSPGLLERPGISDAEGYPVPVDKRPTEEEPLGWRLVVSPATDIEGWQYGSVFKCGFFANNSRRLSSRGCSAPSQADSTASDISSAA